MGTVGVALKARGHMPRSLWQKVEGPRADLTTLTEVLDKHERLNRRARRALEKVTSKRKRRAA